MQPLQKSANLRNEFSKRFPRRTQQLSAVGSGRARSRCSGRACSVGRRRHDGNIRVAQHVDRPLASGKV